MKLLRILRWLLLLPLIYVAGIGAWITLGLSLNLLPALVKIGSNIGIPPQISVEFAGTAAFLIEISLITVPVALFVRWAMRSSLFHCLSWALAAAILIDAIFAWSSRSMLFPTVSRVAVSISAVVALSSAILATWKNKRRQHGAALTSAFLLLTLPTWFAWARSSKQPPILRPAWSTELQQGTWKAMNTGSTFAGTRQVVFAADRIIAVLDAGVVGYEGKTPMSNYRLLSLNRSTGHLKDLREFKGRWGGMPYVFATNNGKVILSGSKLELLNPDLTETGIEFQLDRGRAIQISPDGKVLAWELDPGTTLIDTTTLNVTGTKFEESVPTSVSPNFVISNNHLWYRKSPNDHAFVTVDDGKEQKLIFHGPCGDRPDFLSDARVLILGCGDMQVVDPSGTAIAHTNLDCCYATFAGVSQDGRRFAVNFHDERGDPSMLLYERFIIYDANSLRPLATIVPAVMPERQSWSAFSPDGRYFVAGSPDLLSLYEVPDTI